MLRRLLQLFIGLMLYGVSTAMFVRADLGADPRNVFIWVWQICCR